MANVALAATYGVRANDRVNLTNSSLEVLPTIVSIAASGVSRVGADATVGHIWSGGNLELADRATAEGQVVLDATAPKPAISQFASIIGGTVRRPAANATTHSIWSFAWPTKTTENISGESSSDGSTVTNTLKPGVVYEKVVVRRGQVLKIKKAGNYFISELTLEGKLELDNQAIIEGGGLARLAVANVPVMNGDVVLANQDDVESPAFMMAVLSSGWVTVGGAFQGLLAAPAANINITGYGNSAAPLPHRGAFWGATVEIHQGGVLTQGVNAGLFLDPSEGVIDDDANASPSTLVRYVPSVGYIDGTDCNHWPKGLNREKVLDGVLSNTALTEAAKSDAIKKLGAELVAKDVGTMTSIGSSRTLTLASYATFSEVGGAPTRNWVAVDLEAKIGYDLSQRFLCTESEVLDTAKNAGDPTCKRQKMALYVGNKLTTVQVLRRVSSKARSYSDAIQTVVLVAPKVELSAPSDSFPKNTIQLDVNVIVAAKNVTTESSSSSPVNLDVKPFAIKPVNNASSLVEAIGESSRSGIVAVFADEISNVAMVSTHNGMRVAKYTPLDRLSKGHYRPAIVTPSYGAPADDTSVYSEYVFPKRWVLDYYCDASFSDPVKETFKSPPDYFCQHWKEVEFNSTCLAEDLNTRSNCGKLWCSGTLTNNVDFWQTTVHQSIACDATVHNHLLKNRRDADKGGLAIVAVGDGGDAVEVRAPQGEGVKFNTEAITHASNTTKPLLLTDVSTALMADRAFYPPSSNTHLFWPNPADFSSPTLNPTALRCAMSATIGGYMTSDAEVFMTCGQVDSPFPLTVATTDLLKAYTGQEGYARTIVYTTDVSSVTFNSASVWTNNTTTSYLTEVLNESNGSYGTHSQTVLKSSSRAEANLGAQVVSAGDYFRLLDTFATNAGLKNGIPGAEFEQARSVLEPLTALITEVPSTTDAPLNAVQIATAEKKRVVTFAEQYYARSYLAANQPDCVECPQIWQTDMTGTPYGSVLTGWEPPWFAGNATLTLEGVESEWQDTVDRTTLFYDLTEMMNSEYDYRTVLTTVKNSLSTLSASATQAATNADTATPTQVQALLALKDVVVSVQDARKELADGIRAALKLESSATELEVEQAAAKQVASCLQACSLAHTPKDPWVVAYGMMASVLPLVAGGFAALDGINNALDDANQGSQFFLNFNSVGSNNAMSDWLDATQPITEFLGESSEYLKIAGKVAGGFKVLTKALNSYQGNCPNGSEGDTAAKAVLLALANNEGLARTMENQLGTLVGTIAAIQGNAQYYHASSYTMGQLAAETNRINTQLSDSQVSSDLNDMDSWKKMRRGLLVACVGAHTAIKARLPMLAQLSRTLATNAGRATTQPALMIPAWDAYDGTAHKDVQMALPYNLWEPTHQVTITGVDRTTNTSGDSFMKLAVERWEVSNRKICNATGDGAKVTQVFDLTKDITGTQLKDFLTKGWVSFSVNLTDWLFANSYDPSVSPSVIRKDLNGSFSTLLSAPVFWDVAFEGCIGSEADPCCDEATIPCTRKLTYPNSLTPQIVRMGSAWVPTYDSSCPSDSVATMPNDNLEGMRQVGGFPVATQVCQSAVMVPPVYQPATPLDGIKSTSTWADEREKEICMQVSLTNWKFQPVRGVPLFGEWVFTDKASNAEIVAKCQHTNALDSNGQPTVVRTISPSASFAADNSDLKAIRLVLSAMAEPKASQAPVASYKLLDEYPAE